jgi:multidrug resistance efflux pump
MSARRWIAVAIVLVAVAAAAGGGIYWSTHRMPEPMRLSGTVEIQEVRLSSKIGGRIKAVLVREGAVLQPGQVLCELEAPELEAQREQARRKRDQAAAALEKLMNGARPEEIAVADAAVATAEAKLALIKAGWRTEEVEQARKDLAALVAQLDLAKVEWDRERVLAPSRASTESRFDTTRSDYLRLTSQVAAAKARLSMLEAGPRKEEVTQAEAEVTHAKAQRDLVKAPARSEDIAEATAHVGELEARVKELDAQLAEAVVKAPEPCVVEVLTVRPGDILAPNQPVGRVLRAGDLWVKAYVPATELGRVKLNQAVEVTIDGFPGKRFAGTIDQIAAVSEFTPRNIQSVDERANQMFGIRVRVADTQGIFKSGMAADVYVPVQ